MAIDQTNETQAQQIDGIDADLESIEHPSNFSKKIMAAMQQSRDRAINKIADEKQRLAEEKAKFMEEKNKKLLEKAKLERKILEAKDDEQKKQNELADLKRQQELIDDEVTKTNEREHQFNDAQKKLDEQALNAEKEANEKINIDDFKLNDDPEYQKAVLEALAKKAAYDEKRQKADDDAKQKAEEARIEAAKAKKEAEREWQLNYYRAISLSEDDQNRALLDYIEEHPFFKGSPAQYDTDEQGLPFIVREIKSANGLDTSRIVNKGYSIHIEKKNRDEPLTVEEATAILMEARMNGLTRVKTKGLYESRKVLQMVAEEMGMGVSNKLSMNKDKDNELKKRISKEIAKHVQEGNIPNLNKDFAPKNDIPAEETPENDNSGETSENNANKQKALGEGTKIEPEASEEPKTLPPATDGDDSGEDFVEAKVIEGKEIGAKVDSQSPVAIETDATNVAFDIDGFQVSLTKYFKALEKNDAQAQEKLNDGNASEELKKQLNDRIAYISKEKEVLAKVAVAIENNRKTKLEEMKGQVAEMGLTPNDINNANKAKAPLHENKGIQKFITTFGGAKK